MQSTLDMKMSNTVQRISRAGVSRIEGVTLVYTDPDRITMIHADELPRRGVNSKKPSRHRAPTAFTR